MAGPNGSLNGQPYIVRESGPEEIRSAGFGTVAPLTVTPAPGVYVRPDRPRTPRLALVGFCEPHRNYVPYDDPDLSVWGLNRGYVFMPRYDDWFEMHGPGIYKWAARRPPEHGRFLAEFKGRVFLHQFDPEIPNSIAYPLKEVAEDVGAGAFRLLADKSLKPQTEVPYLSSSIAYQLGLAIHEGYEQIELYGIDLNTGGEYSWQKPGVEWLIGIAMARGIKVVIPEDCALLKGKLYGRGFMKPEGEGMTRSQYETRKAELEQKLQQIGATYHQMVGRQAAIADVLQDMPPGLNHEKVSKKAQEYAVAAANLQAQANQTEGALKETMYWISFTPEGQPGEQALEQIAAAEANGAVEQLVQRTEAEAEAFAEV